MRRQTFPTSPVESERPCVAGLVIVEATTVSEMANGWADSPGIYTDEMQAGWKKVCDAVHGEGGTIVCQLWYIGRAGHSSFMPEGMNIVSASAIPIQGDGVYAAVFTKLPHETPTALTLEQVEAVVVGLRARWLEIFLRFFRFLR